MHLKNNLSFNEMKLLCHWSFILVYHVNTATNVPHYGQLANGHTEHTVHTYCI
jgi:hypothetical protein